MKKKCQVRGCKNKADFVNQSNGVGFCLKHFKDNSLPKENVLNEDYNEEDES